QVPLAFAVPSRVRRSVTKSATGPESESAQFHFTVTSVLFQPSTFATGVCESNVIVGSVLSIFTSRVALAKLPALSVQVPLAFAVPSRVRRSVTKSATGPESESAQFHFTVTSVLFQPSTFATGVCESNVIVGSVLSTL